MIAVADRTLTLDDVPFVGIGSYAAFIALCLALVYLDNRRSRRRFTAARARTDSGDSGPEAAAASGAAGHFVASPPDQPGA